MPQKQQARGMENEKRQPALPPAAPLSRQGTVTRDKVAPGARQTMQTDLELKSDRQLNRSSPRCVTHQQIHSRKQSLKLDGTKFQLEGAAVSCADAERRCH